MVKKIKISLVLFLITTLPILLSFDPITYNSSYYAKYQSPEGILFLSYTEQWDEEKLYELYKELASNKHGLEINLLQEVRVMGGTSPSNSRIKGVYHPFINSITLYNGNNNTDTLSYRDTLAHEYGHHFAYYYFPFHHFSFSKWAELRGLKDTPARWDSFWNYSIASHQWHPEEIFAEDYVLLYGATSKVNNVNDVYTNETFYLRTQHENQDIQNVLGNIELQNYLEEETGLKIDKDRRLKTPMLVRNTATQLTFSISEKKDVAYRLNLTFYKKDKESESFELLEITNDNTDKVSFELEDVLKQQPLHSEHVMISVDVVDLNTSLGFATKGTLFHLKEGRLY